VADAMRWFAVNIITFFEHWNLMHEDGSRGKNNGGSVWGRLMWQS
jgi:hypothetical protein